ncbi:MAG: DUF4838 domain-containing protein [Lentisphaeria bacterium]|nr:DUF4838 domain-containing protein [Lentisphaeria bacterium]
MKPLRMIPLFVSAMLVAIISSPLHGANLATNGKTKYSIVVPDAPSPSVAWAAQELKRFLGEISGAEFPIVAESASNSSHEIVLAATTRISTMGVQLDPARLGDEGYVLKTVEDRLLIAGTGLRGTLYGVYGLLQDHFGCRWFTPDVSRIPKCETLPLPQLDETVVPRLEYRWPAVRDCYDGDWCARNRVNVGAELEERHGGAVKFCGWAHTFSALVPAKKHFKDHPEYFSLIDGRRQSGRSQLCCTNEHVVRLCIDGIRERMRSNPDATYFSVSQNDWGNYCQCDRCQALAKREESQMGPVLQLVNRVAEAVQDEFPTKRVTTLAYQWSRRPPKTIRPLPNVTIRLCTIECCFAHSMASCDFQANVRFRKDIKGWAEICDNLWIWNYTTNFRHYYLPHPSLRAVNDGIQFYLAHNVKGIYEQDTKLTLHGDQSALGGYIMAQFLWNPEYDEDLAVDEFMNAVHGPAASSMREYFDLLHGEVEKKNLHVRCYATSQSTFLSPELLAKAQSLFDQAEAAVKNDQNRLRRVRFARMSVDFACIERSRAHSQTECTLDHATFTVTPRNDAKASIERFLRTASEAKVLTLSERRLSPRQYEKTLGSLVAHRMRPYDPAPVEGTKAGLRYFCHEADSWPKGGVGSGEPVKTGVIPNFDLSVRTRDRMFGVIFEGLFHAEQAGIYTFRVRAETGSIFSVAGEAVVNARTMNPSRTTTAFAALKAGWHPIRLEFREFGHNDGLDISCLRPGEKKATRIQAEELRHQ